MLPQHFALCREVISTCGIDELELGISSVLLRLSTLALKRDGGFRITAVTPGKVGQPLKAAYRLRVLGDGLNVGIHQADVAIGIE